MCEQECEKIVSLKDKLLAIGEDVSHIEQTLKHRLEKIRQLETQNKDVESTKTQCESYPDGWRHCTLHISPYGAEVHGDGDLSILKKFKEMQQGVVEYRLLIKKLIKLNQTLTNLVPSDIPVQIFCKKCQGTGEVDDTLRSVRAGMDINKMCSECRGSGKVDNE